MPGWAWVLYGCFAVILLGWMGWISILILKHSTTLSIISETFKLVTQRCQHREAEISDLKIKYEILDKRLDRVDRNVIKIGIQLGIGDPTLERGEL